MAFLQKKPNISTSTPLYTLSSSEACLIIGLGNPGNKYDNTRHNIGFAIVDEFARANNFPAWSDKKSMGCSITTAPMGNKKVILAKPTTYMNSSGSAARFVMSFYKLRPAQVLATYDELALDFGQLRTRVGGTDAGHNGVKSLISHVGPEFGRLRVGIANELSSKKDSAEFVLSKFTKDEQTHLSAITNEACVLITEYVFNGKLEPGTFSVL